VEPSGACGRIGRHFKTATHQAGNGRRTDEIALFGKFAKQNKTLAKMKRGL